MELFHFVDCFTWNIQILFIYLFFGIFIYLVYYSNGNDTFSRSGKGSTKSKRKTWVQEARKGQQPQKPLQISSNQFVVDLLWLSLTLAWIIVVRVFALCFALVLIRCFNNFQNNWDWVWRFFWVGLSLCFLFYKNISFQSGKWLQHFKWSRASLYFSVSLCIIICEIFFLAYQKEKNFQLNLGLLDLVSLESKCELFISMFVKVLHGRYIKCRTMYLYINDSFQWSRSHVSGLITE